MSIQNFIKSPLNYTWWKYKLLPQLFSIFPEKFWTFVDLFCWWVNVWVNVNANKIICTDKQDQLIRIFEVLKKNTYEESLKNIENIIEKYQLSYSEKKGYEFYGCDSLNWLQEYNKPHFMKLRDEYNSLEGDSELKDYMLLTLIFYGFNNQIRFNSQWGYNIPVWKRDVNWSITKNLKMFVEALREKNIEFISTRFQDFKVPSNSFVYCDPPYYLTTASYNENWAWTDQDEQDLLDYLKDLDSKWIKFALSNVIEHKWKTHNLLLDWIKENNFKPNKINSNYNNSNYQKNSKKWNWSIEVLVTNY